MFPATLLSPKHRFSIIGIVLALLPFPFVAFVSHRTAAPAPPRARPGLTASDLDHFAGSAYQAVDSSQRELSVTLSIAGNMLAHDHGVRQLKGRALSWPVAGGHPVKLPPLSIRKMPLLPAGNPRRGFVTEFSALSGTQCGIFQRMNSAGDMLSIVSSQQTVGAVFAASSPAAAAALAKKPYFGPLAVAGFKNLAGFEPIIRVDGAVIGMLEVSFPEKDRLNQIRRAVSQLPASTQAELFAGAGDLPIPQASLAEILGSARRRPAQAVEARYSVPEKGEMVAHIRYFAPWDWLVGAAVPLSAMAAPPVAAVLPADHTVAALTLIFLAAALLSAMVWWRSSGYLSTPVLAAVAKLKENVEGLLGIAAKAARPAVSPQNSVLQKTSAVIAQAGRNSHALMNAVGETVLSSKTCKTHAENAAGEIEAMQSAMAELASSNSQVSSLVKEIGSIALQSRLLALNASIEAARAGHHGSSFSVVADEFGKLAERCSENAKNTTALLTSSVAVSTSSTEHLARLHSEIASFSERTDRTAQSLAQLLDATNGQVRTLSEAERLVQNGAKGGTTAAAVDVEIRAQALDVEIRAQALALEQHAEEIAAAVAAPANVNKTAKQRAVKSRSFAAKAPADNQSARRAY